MITGFWALERRECCLGGDSIWLFDITCDADAHAWLRAIYQAAGLSPLAETEAAKLQAAAGGNPSVVVAHKPYDGAKSISQDP